MRRCSICDQTDNGGFTHALPKNGLSFYNHPREPWLLVCSDCVPYEPDLVDDRLEAGEVGTIDGGFDD